MGLPYRGTYATKKDKSQQSRFNVLPKAAKLRRNTPKDYLREDSFPRDREEYIKRQKKVDIKQAFTLTDDNPYSELLSEFDDKIKEAEHLEKEAEARQNEPSDAVIKQSLQSRKAWEAQKPQEDLATAQQRKLQQMASSAQALSQKQLAQRKLKPIDRTKFQAQAQERTKISFHDEERPQEVVYAPIQTPEPDFSPDLDAQVAQQTTYFSKIKSIAHPLRELLETRLQDENGSYKTRLVANLNGHLEQNKTRRSEHESSSLEELSGKRVMDAYQQQRNQDLEQKMTDFEERTKKSDPIIFGYAPDPKKFDPQEDKYDSDAEKVEKAMSKSMKKNKRNLENDDAERFPGEESDAPHENLFVDVPLTAIEMELKAERDARKEEYQEQKRREQEYGDRGDAYITDIEEVDSEGQTVRSERLAEARETLEEKLLEHSIDNPEKKARVEVVDGTLLVDGVSVPHITKPFIDELYGRMPLRERRRLEKRLANEEMRLKRIQRRNSQSKRYIYDGDSQFTRRQVRVAEQVALYLQRTLEMPQFRALDTFGILIEHVTINRDLSSAVVFWTTASADVDGALQLLNDFKPQIRKYFAKQTSLLKISPTLEFIKAEVVKNLEDADKVRDSLIHQHLEMTQPGTADQRLEGMRFMDSPLSKEMREYYDLPEKEPEGLSASVEHMFREDRIKSLLWKQRQQMEEEQEEQRELMRETMRDADINEEDLRSMRQGSNQGDEYFSKVAGTHSQDRQEQKQVERDARKLLQEARGDPISDDDGELDDVSNLYMAGGDQNIEDIYEGQEDFTEPQRYRYIDTDAYDSE